MFRVEFYIDQQNLGSGQELNKKPIKITFHQIYVQDWIYYNATENELRNLNNLKMMESGDRQAGK